MKYSAYMIDELIIVKNTLSLIVIFVWLLSGRSSRIVEIEIERKKNPQKEKAVEGVVRSSPSLSFCESKYYPS